MQSRRHTIRRFVVILALAGGVLACGVAPSAPSPVAASSLSGELAYCAAQINAFRASVGLPALTRSRSLEDFATTAATADGLGHVAHGHFAVMRGSAVSAAETEILWWRGYAVRTVIEQGLDQMWRSGPTGEHYDILAGPYTEVGCGIFVNGTEVTVAQDFR